MGVMNVRRLDNRLQATPPEALGLARLIVAEVPVETHAHFGERIYDLRSLPSASWCCIVQHHAKEFALEWLEVKQSVPSRRRCPEHPQACLPLSTRFLSK